MLAAVKERAAVEEARSTYSESDSYAVFGDETYLRKELVYLNGLGEIFLKAGDKYIPMPEKDFLRYEKVPPPKPKLFFDPLRRERVEGY